MFGDIFGDIFDEEFMKQAIFEMAKDESFKRNLMKENLEGFYKIQTLRQLLFGCKTIEEVEERVRNETKLYISMIDSNFKSSGLILEQLFQMKAFSGCSNDDKNLIKKFFGELLDSGVCDIMKDDSFLYDSIIMSAKIIFETYKGE